MLRFVVHTGMYHVPVAKTKTTYSQGISESARCFEHNNNKSAISVWQSEWWPKCRLLNGNKTPIPLIQLIQIEVPTFKDIKTKFWSFPSDFIAAKQWKKHPHPKMGSCFGSSKFSRISSPKEPFIKLNPFQMNEFTHETPI